MKKIILGIGILAIGLSAAEFEYGHGKFYLKGGFAALNSEISADVSTYSLVEQHKNIFSDWFYKYNITWISSDDMTQAQSNLSSAVSWLPSSVTSLAVDYKIRGLDANVVLGRDLFKNARSYIGAGVLLGVSVPSVESDNSNSSGSVDILKDTDTKITTYKLGLNVTGNTAFNRFVSLYGSGSYAYQTGRVKNSDVDVSTDANGNYMDFDIGIRFTPFSAKYKAGFLTLSPKLYATLGYRYQYWQLNDIKVNVTGVDLTYSGSDLKMKDSVAYVGIGYSF